MDLELTFLKDNWRYCPNFVANMDYGSSLEQPRKGDCLEYPESVFFWEK